MTKVGVLAVHGSVEEHLDALQKLKIPTVKVKRPQDLSGLQGLILPGGESTNMALLTARFGLRDAICKKWREGLNLWGTCAGAILLAREVVEEKRFKPFGLLEVKIARNAYGRQLDSFETILTFGPKQKKIEAVFIRAPRFLKIGVNLTILAQYQNYPVAILQNKGKNGEGAILATSFHPELTEDLSVLSFFCSI